VARLKEAGAVIVGMTCMHEIGMGVSGCNIQDGGPHRNPHNLMHYSGGSSSGSATAVASGIVPIAVGADGGGSIRIPAALCGVWGIKPSFGRVPDRPDHTVASCGPIAGSIRDTCLAYLVMSGPDASLPVSKSLPNPHMIGFDQTKSLKGVRVGVYPDYFEHSSPEVRNASWKMIKGIEALGGEVQEIEIANLDAMRLAHLVIINSEVNTEMDRYFSADPSLFQIDNQLILSVTRQLSARDYISALMVRTHAMRVMSRLFDKVDVIALPTTGITAPKVGRGAELYGESNLPALGRIARFAFLGNLCGLPGMSIPAGSDSSGLPIGFQLLGGHCREDIILRVANALDAGGYALQNRPPNFYNNVEKLLK
jgi:Asp-tRNA(Asn)/Glu-tRNA(Gln) amidotransferase A subunit family amidase